MNINLFTAITVLVISIATVFLSAVSAYLIAQTKKVLNFSNAFKVYSQVIIVMLQAFIVVFFCFRIEYTLESDITSLEKKYNIILLSIGILLNLLLIIMTLINLIILLPPGSKRGLKAFAKKIAEKLPAAVAKFIENTLHKLYVNLKKLAIKNCKKLIQLLEGEGTSNDDNI